MTTFFRSEDRELTPDEASLLAWLLSAPKPELESYRVQLATVRVLGSCTCGCPTIDLGVGAHPTRRTGAVSAVVDAHGTSPSGHPVDVTLIARGGELSELEVVSHLGFQPVGLPQPSDLEFDLRPECLPPNPYKAPLCQ